MSGVSCHVHFLNTVPLTSVSVLTSFMLGDSLVVLCLSIGKELEHCCAVTPPSLPHSSAAGISRSVTITVMYLMTVSKLKFEEALSVVQHCREMANPNMGFRAQLVAYQQDNVDMVREWQAG